VSCSMVKPGETPVVSIVILNFTHPEIIDVCLRTLTTTEHIPYEVVVVDNGSNTAELERLIAESRAIVEPELSTLAKKYVAEQDHCVRKIAEVEQRFQEMLGRKNAFLQQFIAEGEFFAETKLAESTFPEEQAAIEREITEANLELGNVAARKLEEEQAVVEREERIAREKHAANIENGSATVQTLEKHLAEGRITTLVLEPVNHFFSEGNNIGVRNTNPASEYILLMNSDVGITHPDWLKKQVGWMEGTIVVEPTVWASQPTIANPGPRDIVSIGWSYDENLIRKARPEGWCCMFRRPWFRELSSDLPFHGGFEEALARSVREGARAGCLWNYAPYLIHREGGSGGKDQIETILAQTKRQPEMEEWFKGLDVESLDFTVGPDEHSSYMKW